MREFYFLSSKSLSQSGLQPLVDNEERDKIAATKAQPMVDSAAR